MNRISIISFVVLFGAQMICSNAALAIPIFQYNLFSNHLEVKYLEPVRKSKKY
jgi:hypothetical protein